MSKPFKPEEATPEQIRLLCVLLDAHQRSEAQIQERLTIFESRLATIEHAIGTPASDVELTVPSAQKLTALLLRLAQVEEHLEQGRKLKIP